MVVVSFMRFAGNVGMTGYTRHRQRALITGFSSKIHSPGHVFDWLLMYFALRAKNALHFLFATSAALTLPSLTS
jgi:hypothetical protein